MSNTLMGALIGAVLAVVALQFGFWGFFLAALLFTPPVVLLIWALTSPANGKGALPG